MTEEKQITILNMSDETRKAAETLMQKEDCPFTSLEDCIASLMAFRMQLKASGDFEKVRLLDTTYHLEGIKVINSIVTEEDADVKA